MLPAIARPSLFRSETAERISHWELTPLKHSRHPLARQIPHRHYTMVCVCVYVTYVYLTLNIFHNITIADYLRLLDPFAIPAIL